MALYGSAFVWLKSLPTILCPSCEARRMAESAAMPRAAQVSLFD
jgi:hypothetical protein